MRSSCKKMKSLLLKELLVLLLVPALSAINCVQTLAEGPTPATSPAASAGTSQAQSSAAVTDGAPNEETATDSRSGGSRRAKRALRKRESAAENSSAPRTTEDDKQTPSNANPPLRRRRAGAALNSSAGLNREIAPGMGRPALDLSLLNLSEEQKSRITALRSKTRGKGKEIMLSIKAKRMEMRDMMFDPSFSAAQIKAKASELRALVSDMEANKLDDFLAIRSVLSPDQMKKLQPGANKGMAENGSAQTPSPVKP